MTCSVSVLQDEQTSLRSFNLINERCLAIRVVRDAERHMTTTGPMVLLPPSLSLSHCGTVGGRPPCLDARSQATVLGRKQ